MLRFIPREQLMQMINYSELVETVRDALIKLHKGQGELPPRFSASIRGNWWGLMLGYVEGMGIGVKVVNLYPGNAAKGIETIHGVVILFNETDGTPLLAMDGSSLTGLRTAAASALSIMATDASTDVLGFIGTGEQARYHALVFSRLFKVREVYATSRGLGRLMGFINYVQELGIKAHAAANVEEVIDECGTVVIATTSTSPVLTIKPRPGSHVVSIGAPKPVNEVSRPILEGASCILADNREAVLNEAGEDFTGLRLMDLSEVLSGDAKCVRGNGYTVYKSVGFSTLDVAAAYYVYSVYTKGSV
ncbi:ornithine cyclodeaminase family protein [Caldivirga maquilingensis]|uniref:Ornithine cyclodeaminase/mu-crystallin n=1 Tax=Caldivirga maquilingensis (strain ATCC 700844 / DSM 13496 / JCM 10307 / IC-167) TaxID=397948 RepID=A8MAQ6_CALMQ|nr:ornithine cyclodeaminase family protein [Caldivirga maquilingensis]ABW01092.1 ornithine cyclodeaminase/mu-crystallin [Caldivirga maquilingensis IC-167]